MADKGFIFDYSKCVGCHACIVACYNENHTKPPISWRQVSSFNKLRVPLSGFINLSIACNHCQDAPCLKACPAHAYEKDRETGAIIHYPERCIGCKFCTWSCPFDAPKYNVEKGIVEKCNFCIDRLKAGLIPACTNACPTGALSFGDIKVEKHSTAPGMSARQTNPRINFVNQEILSAIPRMDIGVTGFDHNKSYLKLISAASKINTINEWPLVIFTLISSFLVGWMLFLTYNNQVVKYPYLFATLGVVGMVISMLHLGKPFKAYRSIFNLKTSWLSREILSFTLFLGVSFVVLFIYSQTYLYYLSALVGLFLLVSIEFVYLVADKKYSTPIHSANTILTAITFGFLISDLNDITVGLLAFKAILYIVRYAKKDLSVILTIVSFLRFFIGIMIPLISLLLLTNIKIVLIVPFVIGELIDRFEYYSDLHIDTPSHLLNKPLSSIDK